MTAIHVCECEPDEHLPYPFWRSCPPELCEGFKLLARYQDLQQEYLEFVLDQVMTGENKADWLVRYQFHSFDQKIVLARAIGEGA